jgi:hypothetical protein
MMQRMSENMKEKEQENIKKRLLPQNSKGSTRNKPMTKMFTFAIQALNRVQAYV